MAGDELSVGFYELLQIPPTSSPQHITDAVRNRRRHFSNRANNAPDVADRFHASQVLARIEEAGNVLGNDLSRQDYDRQHGFGAPVGGTGSGFAPGPGPGGDQDDPFRPIGPAFQPFQGGGGSGGGGGPRPGGGGGPLPGGGGGGPAPKWPGTGGSGGGPPWWLSGGGTRRRLVAAAKQHPKRTVAIVIAVIVVIATSNAGGGQKGAPGNSPGGVATPSTEWPAGSSPGQVVAPVLAALQSCAKAATSSPANCPQQGTDVTTVLWQLYGDPSAGAQITYTSGVFTVLGHAIMTETDEQQNSAPQIKVDGIGYQATVNWNGGHPSLASLGQLQQEPTPPITITLPASPADAQVEQVFTAAFQKCLTATTLRLALGCLPIDESFAANGTATAVSWKSNEDPLLNARVTWDSGYGIYHVVGSYLLTVTWQDQFGAQSKQDSGNYDAQLADTGGQLQVLAVGKS